MAKVTEYSETQLKIDFMAISSPEEYMKWREKYPGYVFESFDDEMETKFQEILFMLPREPFDKPYFHKELWKKE